MPPVYYTNSEDELQELIRKSKLGHDQAQMELLKIFDNYLAKFVNLLYYAKYDLKNYDVRTFVVLFVADPGLRTQLKRQKMNAAGYRAVQDVVRGVQYMTQRYGDIEDIQQTVRMAFLACVMTYTRREPIPFSGFIYSYYKFILKKFVDTFLIDQLGRKTFPLITDEEREDEDGELQVGFRAPPTDYLEDMLGTEKIDEFWTLGETCNPPFDVLTVQERQLLRWRFEDGYKASDIAYRITEHPNTLREHFSRIRRRLREAMDTDLGDVLR